jgi:uncharacterized Fe-S cluster-containing radical SAM superfamily enzyme
MTIVGQLFETKDPLGNNPVIRYRYGRRPEVHKDITFFEFLRLNNALVWDIRSKAFAQRSFGGATRQLFDIIPRIFPTQLSLM